MEGLRRYGGVIAGSREKKNEVEEANGSGEILTGGAVSGAAA